MTPVVIDAPAGIELVVDTVRGRVLRRLLPSDAVPWVPELFYVECGAVLRRWDLNAILTPAQVTGALEALMTWPLRVRQVRRLFTDAWLLRANLTFGAGRVVGGGSPTSPHVPGVPHNRHPVVQTNESVGFAYDGYSYALDLCPPHVENFHATVQTMIGWSSERTRAGTGRRSRRTTSSAAVEGRARSHLRSRAAQCHREWSRGNGYPELGNHGRIPQHIVAEYETRSWRIGEQRLLLHPRLAGCLTSDGSRAPRRVAPSTCTMQ